MPELACTNLALIFLNNVCRLGRYIRHFRQSFQIYWKNFENQIWFFEIETSLRKGYQWGVQSLTWGRLKNKVELIEKEVVWINRRGAWVGIRRRFILAPEGRRRTVSSLFSPWQTILDSYLIFVWVQTIKALGLTILDNNSIN